MILTSSKRDDRDKELNVLWQVKDMLNCATSCWRISYNLFRIFTAVIWLCDNILHDSSYESSLDELSRNISVIFFIFNILVICGILRTVLLFFIFFFDFENLWLIWWIMWACSIERSFETRRMTISQVFDLFRSQNHVHRSEKIQW